MSNTQSLPAYLLQLADDNFVHGHRLGEWCGHAPELEVDMAITNIALDLIGASRSLYQYVADIEGNGQTEDSYPYLRQEREFRNLLLVELPKGDFADLMARCLFFDIYQYHYYTGLTRSHDERLAAIATKTLKEISYHRRFSSEWVVRLGDGTSESHQRMQDAIHRWWDYTPELFKASSVDQDAFHAGFGIDVPALKPLWEQEIAQVLQEATLSYPLRAEGAWFQQGGREGLHTEHMGYILADVQYLQRAYPGASW